MKRATFYVCKKCGNIVVKAFDGGGELVCCGEPMSIMEPNTVDAATEKHVPFVERENNNLIVTIGSVEHPMEEDHYIAWIYLVTEEGVVVHCLKPGEKPKATFDVSDLHPLAVYELCNLHGLWKKDL